MVTVWELWTTALTMIVAYLSSAQGSDTPCSKRTSGIQLALQPASTLMNICVYSLTTHTHTHVHTHAHRHLHSLPHCDDVQPSGARDPNPSPAAERGAMRQLEDRVLDRRFVLLLGRPPVHRVRCLRRRGSGHVDQDRC